MLDTSLFTRVFNGLVKLSTDDSFLKTALKDRTDENGIDSLDFISSTSKLLISDL